MTRARSKKDVALSISEDMSAVERQWEIDAPIEIEKLFGQPVIRTLYQPISLRLPYVKGAIRYTPDFMHVLKDGELVFVETKATRFQDNYAYSILRLKIIATKFYEFHFVVAMLERKRVKGEAAQLNWKLEKIITRRET